MAVSLAEWMDGWMDDKNAFWVLFLFCPTLQKSSQTFCWLFSPQLAIIIYFPVICPTWFQPLSALESPSPPLGDPPTSLSPPPLFLLVPQVYLERFPPQEAYVRSFRGWMTNQTLQVELESLDAKLQEAGRATQAGLYYTAGFNRWVSGEPS